MGRSQSILFPLLLACFVAWIFCGAFKESAKQAVLREIPANEIEQAEVTALKTALETLHSVGDQFERDTLVQIAPERCGQKLCIRVSFTSNHPSYPRTLLSPAYFSIAVDSETNAVIDLDEAR